MSVVSVSITGYSHLIAELTEDIDESVLLVPKVIGLEELPFNKPGFKKVGIETENGESEFVWSKLRAKFPI